MNLADVHRIDSGTWKRAVDLHRLAAAAEEAGEHADAARYRELSLAEAQAYRAVHAKPLDDMVRIALNLSCNRSVSVPPIEQQYGPDTAGDYWYVSVDQRSTHNTAAGEPAAVSVCFIKADLRRHHP